MNGSSGVWSYWLPDGVSLVYVGGSAGPLTCEPFVVGAQSLTTAAPHRTCDQLARVPAGEGKEEGTVCKRCVLTRRQLVWALDPVECRLSYQDLQLMPRLTTALDHMWGSSTAAKSPDEGGVEAKPEEKAAEAPKQSIDDAVTLGPHSPELRWTEMMMQPRAAAATSEEAMGPTPLALNRGEGCDNCGKTASLEPQGGTLLGRRPHCCCCCCTRGAFVRSGCRCW